MRIRREAFIVLSFFVLLPSIAFAQASIAGVVRIPPAACVPGVTVKPRAPRSSRSPAPPSPTNRVVPHRRFAPGPHRELQPERIPTVRREGIELGARSTPRRRGSASGALEETITVTGESPIVDVQSVRRQTVIDSDTIAPFPPPARTTAYAVDAHTVTRLARRWTRRWCREGRLRRRRRAHQLRACQRDGSASARPQRRRRLVVHRRRRQRARGDDDHLRRPWRSEAAAPRSTFCPKKAATAFEAAFTPPASPNG